MTTINTGWILSDGQEIVWDNITFYEKTVALINEDKTLSDYINFSEIKEGNIYYLFKNWKPDGSSLYCKQGDNYYQGKKTDGSFKFKKEDIIFKPTIKNQTERTENLAISLDSKIKSISNVIKERTTLNSANLTEIENILKEKSTFKQVASMDPVIQYPMDLFYQCFVLYSLLISLMKQIHIDYNLF